jgi:MoaA/NifB/PqqE/SkfB family radical SAM enzyme
MHVLPAVSPLNSSDLAVLKEELDGTRVLLSHSEIRDNDGYIIQEKDSEITVSGVKEVRDHQYDETLRKTFDALLKKYEPEIVHIHVHAGLSLLPILNAASSLRMKKILSLYDHSLFTGRKTVSCQKTTNKPGLIKKQSLASQNKAQLIYKRAKYIVDQCDMIFSTSSPQNILLQKLFGKNNKFILSEAENFDFSVIYNQVLNQANRSLYLKVGHLCNSKCLYCVAGVADQPFIDLSLLKKKLEEKAADYRSVIFTGGEPSMHPRFFELLAIAYYLGYKIEIQSNIRAFSSEKFTARIKKFNAKIIVCMNSSREDVFDAMADAPGAFKQTVKGVKNLKNNEIDLHTKIIITKLNSDHLTDVVRFVRDFGIRYAMLVFPTPMGLARDNFKKINPRYRDILPEVHSALQWGIDHGMRMSTENIPGCLLDEKYHKYNSEYMNQCNLDGIYLNENKGLYNCKSERMDIQKFKVRGCIKCPYSFKCEGVYREYVRNFGEEEFNPALTKV